jgi:hypothetical protein
MATVNNNWPTPVATDLVKDGWEAIKDLGDAIDTTLGVYAPPATGLTLINTTSFSGVTAQSFNNVFTSAYENYRVLIRGTSNTSVQTIQFRLRASGTDASGANYDRMGLQTQNTANTLTAMNQNAQTTLGLFIIDNANPTFTGYSLDIIGPQLARVTNILAQGTQVESGLVYHRSVGGTHSLSNAYDGFSLINAGSVNFAATVSIYGYNF